MSNKVEDSWERCQGNSVVYHRQCARTPTIGMYCAAHYWHKEKENGKERNESR